MSALETNIYPILNLNDFSAKYRLYKIRGLHRDHPEYYQNRQTLINRMSYMLRTPATVVESGDDLHLVLRADAGTPESPFSLVRVCVYLDPLEEVRDLNFADLNADTAPIAIRFLQFMLQAPLSANPHLWQPGAGKPFFEKATSNTALGVTRYTGFVVRVVPITDGGLGLCVDVANKYVRSQPLPAHMTRQEFRPYKGKHCIYHYGHRWYEIQLREYEDVSVSEYQIGENGARSSLLEFISRESQKPISQELAQIPTDASVILYTTNQGQMRAAPAALCYPVLDSADTARNNRPNALLKPADRFGETGRFVDRYLRNLRFSAMSLQVGQYPLRIPHKMFLLPDYEFGNSRILSVRGTANAQQVSLDSIGRTRLSVLRDKTVGFYTRDPLQRQYIILPQSIQDSFGPALVSDISAAVNELFPQERPYEPIAATYNDRVQQTFVEQGNAILAAAAQQCTKPGFAIVMIHDTQDRRVRQHDQLAAMVIRKFRELDIFAAVIHSAMGRECYQLVTQNNGSRRYVCRNDRKGKLSGYVRNVALNKVLLTNERWPFVLATPLSADLTVGIDVKQHTAGFTVVNRKGNYIRTIVRDSNQKEQLLTQQVRKLVVEVVSKEAQTNAYELPLRSIVVHRDGILWQSEQLGIKKAIDDLKMQGILADDAKYAMLELPKSAAAPVRLYDVSRMGNRELVQNPQIGTYFILDAVNAYLCATGRAFPRHGTVQPVHVKYVEGTLPLESCLQDIYFLTALVWTRPDDCAKDPITVKLTDRRLGEDAETFDIDALEYYVAEQEQGSR
jgi:hypothetical protein